MVKFVRSFFVHIEKIIGFWNAFEGKGRLARRADNLAAIYV
jgi:hypothetical protein